MKKRALLMFAMSLMIASAVYAESSVVRGLSARAEDQRVVVEWNSGIETGVTEYRILRSFDNIRFYQIATVKPEGSNHFYRFYDNDLFKDKNNTYYYEIQIVFASGRTELSATADVSVGSNSVRRTWGSIKALFR